MNTKELDELFFQDLNEEAIPTKPKTKHKDPVPVPRDSHLDENGEINF